MGHPVGRPRDMHRASEATFFGRLHAAQRQFVKSDQKILPEKKIQLAGGEHAVLAAVVHRVNHHEQVAGEPLLLLGLVFLDLGRGADGHAVFDGEGMKVEDVFQNKFGLGRCRLLQIQPEKKIRVRQQRRHEERLDVLAVKLALGGEGK